MIRGIWGVFKRWCCGRPIENHGGSTRSKPRESYSYNGVHYRRGVTVLAPSRMVRLHPKINALMVL